MKTITNNHWRGFIYDYQVPDSILNDYEHLSDCDKTDGWIHYRSNWYHISDFMRFDDNANKWDGYVGLTYFCAVLIKISDCGDAYQIALQLS